MQNDRAKTLCGLATVFVAVGLIAGYVVLEASEIVSPVPGQPIDISMKNLGGFPFNQQDGTINDVPQSFRNLDGKRLNLVGVLWAPQSTTPQLSRFEITYAIPRGSWHLPPQIQQFVQCKPALGRTIL
ncbi:MAG TPA: hypothetical protein VGG19_01485 [Tepidisphaeraceae bacterium]|jgi:hypothetical protein